MLYQHSTDAELKFVVTDVTEERADLARRKEFKFVVPGTDWLKLRRLLEVNARPVVYNRRESKVRSIYFDDASLSACYANLNGLGQRDKLRLRWYDSLVPARSFFVEIKWRRNRVTGKHRLAVTSSQPLGELSYRQITAHLLDDLPVELRPVVLRYHEPTVLVEYSREHYLSTDGAVRLTIDRDIAFFDQTGRRGINTRFRQPLEDLVLVEAKVGVGQEHLVQRMLYPFCLRTERCSKYVHGCQTLGLVSSRLG
ncbi:MAG: polyphosphate polymerase domain-containing protein [Pirellulales bacterium]